MSCDTSPRVKHMHMHISEHAYLVEQLPGLAVICIQRVAAGGGAGGKCGHAAVGSAHDPDCRLAACNGVQQV